MSRRLDVGWPQNRVHKLSKVYPGNKIAPLEGDHFEAEDKLYVVHEHFLSAYCEPYLDCLIFELKKGAFDGQGLESVKFLDAACGDVVLAIVSNRLPSR